MARVTGGLPSFTCAMDMATGALAGNFMAKAGMSRPLPGQRTPVKTAIRVGAAMWGALFINDIDKSCGEKK